MLDSRLVQYVNDHRVQGFDDAAIRGALLEAGWPEPDVNAVLASVITDDRILPTEPSTKKKNRIVKTVVITLLTLGVLVGSVYNAPAILSVFVSDVAPTDYDDLAMQTLTTSREQNAFHDTELLEGAINANRRLMLDYIDEKSGTDEEIQTMINENSQPLAIFAAALTKPYWQDPKYATPEISLEPTPPTDLRAAADLFRLKARLKAKGGAADAALSDMLALARFGQTIISGQNSDIEHLLAIAMIDRAMKEIALVRSYGFSINAAEAARAELAKLEIDMSNFFKVSYRYHLSQMDITISGAPENIEDMENIWKLYQRDYSLQPNRTNAMVAEYLRLGLSYAKDPCGFPAPEPQRGPDPRVAAYLPNGLGVDIYNRVVAARNTMIRKTCETERSIQRAANLL